MLGGPPMFLPGYLPGSFPPAYGPQPARPPALTAAAQPRWPGQPQAAATARPFVPAPAQGARQPVARAAAPDEEPAPRTAELIIPAPGQLGVGRPRPATPAVDWASVGRDLQALGATGWRIETVPGGFSFSCSVPGDRAGVVRRIEATGSTQAEAVRLGLERAEQLRASRP